jgi:hypothetical protein
MLYNFEIFSNDENLFVRFDSLPVVSWHEGITTIIDLDQNGRLLGMEMFLYEEPLIAFEKILEQFQSDGNADIREKGLLYIAFPQTEEVIRRSGFGRRGKIGINENGYLSILIIQWNTPGAGTPYVNSKLALKGFSYKEGSIG